MIKLHCPKCNKKVDVCEDNIDAFPVLIDQFYVIHFEVNITCFECDDEIKYGRVEVNISELST